jgi:hypothetical protein
MGHTDSYLRVHCSTPSGDVIIRGIRANPNPPIDNLNPRVCVRGFCEKHCGAYRYTHANICRSKVRILLDSTTRAQTLVAKPEHLASSSSVRHRPSGGWLLRKRESTLPAAVLLSTDTSSPCTAGQFNPSFDQLNPKYGNGVPSDCPPPCTQSNMAVYPLPSAKVVTIGFSIQDRLCTASRWIIGVLLLGWSVYGPAAVVLLTARLTANIR